MISLMNSPPKCAAEIEEHLDRLRARRDTLFSAHLTQDELTRQLTELNRQIDAAKHQLLQFPARN